MRITLPRLQQLVRLQDKYKLIDKEVPSPSIISTTTYCECEFPKDKQINYDRPLSGTKSSHWKHVLVHSKSPAVNWLSKVEMMPTELISSMNRYKRTSTHSMFPVLISNIELEEPVIPASEGESKVLVYPENRYFVVNESNAETFMNEELHPETAKPTFTGIENRAEVILICGHTQRDIRCGILGPLLKEEFEYNLKERGLLYHPDTNPEGVKVGIISHIGGHAYAGNVLYFDKDGISLWYGRVQNRHVDAIIAETVVGKNIIKSLYRGRY